MYTKYTYVYIYLHTSIQIKGAFCMKRVHECPECPVTHDIVIEEL